MIYLATFNWGWLLASALLGLAMGWIALVHRGQGWSTVTMRKFIVLVAGPMYRVAHRIPDLAQTLRARLDVYVKAQGDIPG